MTSILRPGMVIDKDQQAADRAYKEKLDAEQRAMAATAAQGPVQRQVSQAKPAPKVTTPSLNPPKNPQDQAAYTADVQKRLAELKAPSSNANTRPVPKAIAPVVAKAQQTARNIAATRPAPATGGIRASNDPSNPEIAQKLAEAKTYMQSVGKTNTGYEPPGSMFSSLAGKSQLSGPLGSSGAMATPTAPPGGGLNMAALNASKAQNPGDTFKKGGRVKAKAKSKSSYSSGGKVSSASKRGDGCAQRGKTKGRMI